MNLLLTYFHTIAQKIEHLIEASLINRLDYCIHGLHFKEGKNVRVFLGKPNFHVYLMFTNFLCFLRALGDLPV